MPESTTPESLVSSHGGGAATFSFGGLSSRITKIDASASATPKEMGHLGQAAGSRPILRKSPLVEGAELKVEFLGAAFPTRGQKLSVTVPANLSPTGADLATKAICTVGSVKAGRGEFVKGTCTIKLSGGT